MADREDPNAVIARIEGHINGMRTTSPSGSETLHQKIAQEIANLRRALNGPTEEEKKSEERDAAKEKAKRDREAEADKAKSDMEETEEKAQADARKDNPALLANDTPSARPPKSSGL